MKDACDGDRFEIWTTDEDAPADLAAWAGRTGNVMISSETMDGVDVTIIVRKSVSNGR